MAGWLADWQAGWAGWLRKAGLAGWLGGWLDLKDLGLALQEFYILKSLLNEEPRFRLVNQTFSMISDHFDNSNNKVLLNTTMVFMFFTNRKNEKPSIHAAKQYIFRCQNGLKTRQTIDLLSKTLIFHSNKLAKFEKLLKS